jgi:uncharacterized protein YbjT (DUF2867 family)
VKLLVLGASGRCGQWVVRLGRERGHRITALVRPDSPAPAGDGVEVVRGQVLEPGVLERALGENEAVLSCLGMHRRNPRSPFSPVIPPADLTSRAAAATVAAMRRRGLRRIVAISAAGVGDSRRHAHPLIRFMVGRGGLGVAYRDLEAMERAYAEGGLDWLAVRPVTLVDQTASGRAQEVPRYRLSSKIARADVATWMLDAVERAQPMDRHTVMIGWS